LSVACRQAINALVLTAFALAGSLSPAAGQSLAPRAYWPVPEGTKLLSVGVAYQHGAVVVDPSLPIEDAEASLTSLQVGYLEVFSFFGRTASLGVVIPRIKGTVKGLVSGAAERRDLKGSGDASLTLGLNFLGAPAMSPQEFQAFRKAPEPVLGLSLEVRLPVGQYNSEYLVNLGGNRWAVKPELGYIHPIGDGYVLEANLGSWIYGENEDFVGEPRKQDPLFSIEVHLVRRQRRHFWTSLDLTFYHGGRTQVSGDANDDRLSNVRGGATIVFPLKKGHALRLAGSTSLLTASGGRYNSYLLAYSRAWR
jgi:hypothetical protein